MTIFTNSRYAGQNVVRVEGSDGNVYPTVFRQSPPPARKFLHYTVQMGDRVDILASRYFGDPTLWWIIADANPEILFPTALPVGRVIRIPQQ